MLAFISAAFFLIVTPGPGVMSVAGVGSAFGRQAGLRYLWGLFLGNSIVILAVVTGLAGLILAEHRIRFVLFAASTAYLVYLALKIAFAGSRVGFVQAAVAPGFWNGVTLQFINPKAYAVNTYFFTAFPLASLGFGAETAAKWIAINAVWIPIHVFWLWLGIKLNELNLSKERQRMLNIAMSVSMLIAVGLAVTHTLGEPL